MVDFIVIIPARMNSTRLPGKMLLDVAGLPLIIRVAKRASLSNASRVIVATDHSDIYNTCISYGIDVVMTKDTHTSGTDRLAEVVELLMLAPDQIIVNVQGDEPLIDPLIINQLAVFIQQKNTPIATIAHQIHEVSELFNPNVVKLVLSESSCALYFSRSPIPFDRDNYNLKLNTGAITSQVLRHVGVYAYSAKFLSQYQNLQPTALEHIESLEQLRALYYGYAISVLVIEDNTSIGIDTQDDLIKVINIITK